MTTKRGRLQQKGGKGELKMFQQSPQQERSFMDPFPSLLCLGFCGLSGCLSPGGGGGGGGGGGRGHRDS